MQKNADWLSIALYFLSGAGVITLVCHTSMRRYHERTIYDLVSAVLSETAGFTLVLSLAILGGALTANRPFNFGYEQQDNEFKKGHTFFSTILLRILAMAFAVIAAGIVIQAILV